MDAITEESTSVQQDAAADGMTSGSDIISDQASKPNPVAATDTVVIIVPPVQRRWEYKVYQGDLEIIQILEEYEDLGELQYLVRLANGQESEVSFDELVTLPNGSAALNIFNKQDSDARSTSESSSSNKMVSTRPMRRTRTKAASFTDFSNISLSSDDELITGKVSRTRNQTRRTAKFSKVKSRYNQSSGSDRRPQRRQATRATTRDRQTYTKVLELDDSEDEPDSDSDNDSGNPRLGKRKRGLTNPHQARLTLRGPAAIGTRRSDRTGRGLRPMHEIDEDDIPEVVEEQGGQKIIGTKEVFKPLHLDDNFRIRHESRCDTCDSAGDDELKGPLIYCQGCTVSYHQKCLGPRTTREHLVTKVAEDDFVLQCRRCIGMARQKDSYAPAQEDCPICHKSSEAAHPLRKRKTTKQEQKDREDNNGQDPISIVSKGLINNVNNVLFRCTACFRAFHFHHLPSKEPDTVIEALEDAELASERFTEYCQYDNWTCKECATAPAKIDGLIAWRPINPDKYTPGITTRQMKDDDKEYLVHWEKMSYLKSTWMPGPWVWGVTKHSMRSAFGNRDNGNNLPKMSFKDAIPEEYLRVDIVLDVKYTNVVKLQLEKVDLKRVKEVKSALVKFKGLGYEDVVWDEPPEPEDIERWADFQSAYEDWVRGRYINLPSPAALNTQLKKERSHDFEAKVMLLEQPKTLVGGQLMAYQMDGLNWLYYQWHKEQNAILADEMGLGKTIQVIGFLSTLKEIHGCWPFLVVVPNSTCANWRREIKQWAPALRVVTYFGSSEARRLSKRYELFPSQDKNLRCHVVVTSYDAAQEDDFRKVFRGINWQGLIVDEGQRLKNDRNLLYGALNALRAPFKVLLTGTPLQNNPRELFNLLQFLDDSIDAAVLEAEYAELTKENVPRLHELLRPFFLRRTKAQVLAFLPAMAQIIVPVTLTILQKKLYKSILARNPELLKAIFGGSKRVVAKTERSSLNNILMQLRKCLCHPFVYNRDIEEQSSNATVSHRNLVEASSKLQLLEIMLPKLQERGHRVLIFSQFLNMLDIVEDFLDGLGLFYQRLDGSMGSLQKQKRIDEFNSPDSPLFAFLLSTRAGGVGINLATADTVIILDPDFNPHQDIQALSRAHRIGQKKKVLVFQLTTRATAEEKIMQIGKKKMALDHALIEQMDADEEEAMDVESILRHGTEALFHEDDTNDIRYDSASVDKLLDRSQIENTDIAKDQSAESQFSFARVWANDKGILEDAPDEDSDSNSTPDASLWKKILKERQAEVEREAAEKAEALGRGKRQRQAVDYAKQDQQIPAELLVKDKDEDRSDQSSDTDFESRAAETEDEDSGNEVGSNPEDAAKELDGPHERLSRSKLGVFKRAQVPPPQSVTIPGADQPFPSSMSTSLSSGTYRNGTEKNSSVNQCIACGTVHPVGFCPLKKAGVEYCGLCRQAHYGTGFRKACPNLHDIEHCQLMLDALKTSPEPREYKEMVKKYLVGIIGNLRHDKKMADERRRESLQQQSQPPAQPPSEYGYTPSYYNGSYYHLNGNSGKENQPIDFTPREG